MLRVLGLRVQGLKYEFDAQWGYKMLMWLLGLAITVGVGSPEIDPALGAQSLPVQNPIMPNNTGD